MAEKPQTVDVTAGALVDALKRVKLAVERRPAVPILENVRLSFTAGVIHICATNLDLEIIATCEAKGRLTEGVCVAYRGLFAIAKGYRRADVLTLSIDGIEQEATTFRIVVGGDEEWTIPIFPNGVADWPELVSGELAATEGSPIKLDAGYRMDVLARALAVVSREETRYYLNGVHVAASADDLVTTATDGHRLVSIQRESTNAGAEFEACGKNIDGAIIPAAFVRAIIEATSGPIAFSFYTGQLVAGVRAEGVVIRGKLIDGKFPDYRRVVPEPSACGYEVDRLSLISALSKLSALNALGKDYNELCVITHRAGRVVLESRRRDARTIIPVAGGPLDIWPERPIGMSRRYLAAFAAMARGGALRLLFSDLHGAFRIEDTGSPGATFVLMPARVDDRVAHDAPNKPNQSAA